MTLHLALARRILTAKCQPVENSHHRPGPPNPVWHPASAGALAVIVVAAARAGHYQPLASLQLRRV
jgi:hypothetical protein